MDNVQLEKSHFRIDRDFAKNPTVFRNFEDSRLAMSIFAYFYLQYKNGSFDLFDRLRIDPYKFADEMNYKRAELFRKVEHPVQFSNKKESEIEKLKNSGLPLFETKFENTIYQMMVQNILFTQPVGDTATHRVERITSQQILTSVDIHTDKNNRSKKYYDISIHRTFLAMLNNYFVNIERTTFIVARDSNLSGLYFYLTDIQQYCLGNNVKNYTDVTFDFLCDMANMSLDQEPREMKRILIKKFNAITQKAPELKVSLSFVANGKHKYKPVITCDGLTDSKEEKLQRAIGINNDKVKYAVVEMYALWKDYFTTTYPEYLESNEYLQMKFADWLRADINLDVKCKAMFSIMEKYFPKSEFVQLVKGRDMSLFKKQYFTLFSNILETGSIPSKGLF